MTLTLNLPEDLQVTRIPQDQRRLVPWRPIRALINYCITKTLTRGAAACFGSGLGRGVPLDSTLLESPNRFPFLNHQTNRHRTLKDVM